MKRHFFGTTVTDYYSEVNRSINDLPQRALFSSAHLYSIFTSQILSSYRAWHLKLLAQSFHPT